MILQNLEKYISFKKIPIYKFEEELSLGRGTISKAIKKNGGISTGILENILKKHPDINFEWLITGKGKMLKSRQTKVNKVKEIPLYNIDLIHNLKDFFISDNHDEAILDTIKIPEISSCDGAIHIKGDSMLPLLQNGDIALFKKVNNDDIFYGEMYLISIVLNDSEEYITVKFIQKSEHGDKWVKLVSQNPKYEAKNIPKDKITSLALIRSSIRNYN